jgi:hypothetical protein
VAKARRLDKKYLLGGDIKLGLAALNIGHHFAGEMHRADRVLEAIVRGAGKDIVGAAESDGGIEIKSTDC